MIKRNRRFAFTLIELLVVLAVVSLLAAIILPSVKTLLTDRKGSQAAILVKNFIESARTRAIGKGRTVAVVLERLSSRAADLNGDGVITSADIDTNAARFMSGTSLEFPGSPTSIPPNTNFLPYNTCIKLSLAEEPLPITEAVIASPVMISQVLMGNVQDFSVVSSTGNIFEMLGEYLVAGNEISFGDSPDRFTITYPANSKVHYDYYNQDPSLRQLLFSIGNSASVAGLGERALQPFVDVNGKTWTKFRVYQKPKPIYSQSLQLPKGMCVDLSLSGFSGDRAGLTDYRVRFASDWVRSGTDGVPRPNELRPIYLVFGPDGSFSHVYANERMSTAAVRIDAVDDVFLHIGKIDQVIMPVDTTVLGRNRLAFEQANTLGIKQNLADAGNYVVRLSAKSGAVTAAPNTTYALQEIANGMAPGTATLGDIIQFSRQNTFGAPVSGQ